MASNEALMPGPQGKTPKSYEVEKGHKTESYIVAIAGSKVPPPVKFVKDGQPSSGPQPGEPGHVILLPKDPSPAEIPLPKIVGTKPEPPVRYVPAGVTGSQPPPPKYEPTAKPQEQPQTRFEPPPTKYQPTVGGKPPLPGIDEQPSKNEAMPKDQLIPENSGDNFGLSLAELEKYRNDPFWRTLRWVLFVLFWLLWILMFLVAILIVALSPGCAAKIAPSWWHSSVAYHIWTPSFQDSDGNGIGDLNGAVDRLENVRRLGVQAVWAAPFLLSDHFSDGIRDYKAIDSKLGVNADGDKFIEAVHDKGMKLVISLPVATTSDEHDWFLRSSKASLLENRNYSGYYHWRRTGAEPFLSKYKELDVYYIHGEGQPNMPVLNWQNAALRQDMFDVLSHWIDKGIDGFQLNGIEYLSRKSNGTEANWPAIYDVLRDIKNHVETYANQSEVAKDKKIILFANRMNAKENDKRMLASTGIDSVVNYELGMVGRANQICSQSENNVAGCTHELLTDVMAFHDDNEQVVPMWEFGNPSLSRLTSRVESSKQAEILTMIQLLLPGTNSIYYGEEIGMRDLPNDTMPAAQRGAMQWDESKNAGFSSADEPQIEVNPDYKEVNWAHQYSESRSPLKMFQKLAKMRNRDDTLSMGATHIGELLDSGFTLTRYPATVNDTQGNVIVGAFNFGDSAVTLPLKDIPVLSSKDMSKGEVMTTTSNAEGYYPRQAVDLSSESITLAPQIGVAIKFKA